MTDPLEHITLPYLVPQIIVLSSLTVRDLATKIFSIMALEVPIALTGYAALSVERQITFFTPASIAAVSTLSVPMQFVLTASSGKNSQLGTCLSAAAWKI